MNKPKKDPAEEWIKRLDEGPEEEEGEDFPISLGIVLCLILGGIFLLGLVGWIVFFLLSR